MTIELSRSELRAVAGYAVACARPALAIFECERPDDRRPRAAIDAAQAFADAPSGPRRCVTALGRHTGRLRVCEFIRFSRFSIMLSP